MGLLDDAIREHLELKRRHGAPDEEVKRQAHEALGPIRRRGEPMPIPPDDLLAVDEGPSGDDMVEDVPPHESLAADAGIALDQPVMPEPRGHEPELEPFPPGEEPDAVPLGDSDPAAVPVRAAEPAGAGHAPADDELWLDESDEPAPDDLLEPPGQQTSAFSAADVAAAAGQPVPAEEDVLEETPEFLQETPEHDRLWFEQRPPRRFDFDE
jgi:hypothetical protein